MATYSVFSLLFATIPIDSLDSVDQTVPNEEFSDSTPVAGPSRLPRTNTIFTSDWIDLTSEDGAQHHVSFSPPPLIDAFKPSTPSQLTHPVDPSFSAGTSDIDESLENPWERDRELVTKF